MTARLQMRFTAGSARIGLGLLIGMALGLGAFCCKAGAQVQAGAVQGDTSGVPKPLRWKPPIADEVVSHLLFTQLEDRTDGRDNELRWEGETWIGTDMNRLWIKSEGVFQDGSMSDGDHEVLYDRPIPRVRYFDAQAGVRADLDSGPHRFWSAIGIEGLAPNFFEFEPTVYFRDEGHIAGKVEASYDLRITQRLVAQPQLELNFYSKRDPARGLGTGLADLDTAIRLRYEIRRKLAPYVGFAYTDQYGSTAGYSRRAGEAVANPRFVFGLRTWY
jgi:copper resistance protein B